jgi:hypothetical protein
MGRTKPSWPECKKVLAVRRGDSTILELVERSVVFFSGVPHPHLLGVRALDIVFMKSDRSHYAA